MSELSILATAPDHQTNKAKGASMKLFAVTRIAGPTWTEGKGAFEQPAVNDHSAFMNGLADDPWESTQRVVTTNVEPWELFVGVDRLTGQSASQ